jgi:hypothetical protein
MPTNIAPKHDGHDVVVSVEPQYSQRDASGPAAGAPQVGQLSEAGMVDQIDDRVPLPATRIRRSGPRHHAC